MRKFNWFGYRAALGNLSESHDKTCGIHCVKSVYIRSCSGPFRMRGNTDQNKSEYRHFLSSNFLPIATSLNSEKHTLQKMKFPIKHFFCKCDQIRKKLRIWLHLPKKSSIENFLCSGNGENILCSNCGTIPL